MAITTGIPRLQKASSGHWELLVDGEPYLILGAELQNSSMSSARFMDTIWQNLKDMGINTVLGAVAWEDVEPKEGLFNFTELDGVIAGARAYGLRLIILWFGSFKNGRSSYTPTWVKTNPKRFPRMYKKNNEDRLQNSGVLSIFHDECVKADTKAFSSLLQHLRETDEERTVIMVQVENEVGFHGDSRDRSAVATRLFESPVPNDVIQFLNDDWDSLHIDLKSKYPKFKKTVDQIKAGGSTGNWEDYFGRSMWTEELFMAYHYALYLEKIASSGRKVYEIPLFSNVWLPQPGEPGAASGGGKPGEYPSGGATSTVLDIWLKFAPHLDFISPDIYHNAYTETCSIYTHRGQPLFIPEQRRDHFGARTAWTAIGNFHALGVSPFGIDTQTAKEAAFTDHYKLLGSVSKHILETRRKNLSVTGFCFHDPEDENNPCPPFTVSFKHYNVTVSRAFVLGKEGSGYGMIVELEPSKFLLIGKGFKVEWKSNSLTHSYTEILRFEEKSVIDKETQELRTDRILNGDESRSGIWANMPNDDPDHGECPVPVIIPARTAIAQVEIFSLENEEQL
ncbi:glycoside hydrolase superfamily [Dactylonectria estremocensis]|uniref:Glycoside hydrolase superfamily n=1 Tax=Dactylonectria estremocensis TaxID=1079267 RepID=A0A9P9EMS9_9HYPO|nr:glycoside hydrolase superfamily [Dactylonectria estremocensis]